MKIKTADGEMNVTGQGQGTLNTVLGAVGTAAALGFGTGILGNGRGNRQMSEDEKPVTRYEMGLIRESIAKDNEIALLKANMYTDRAAAGIQSQIAMQQTWNAVQQNNIATMQKMLGDITKFVVPINSIDPVPTTAGTSTATTNSGN